MTAANPGLRRAYRARAETQGHELAWLWYLRRLFDDEGWPEILAAIQHGPREAGIATCLAYVRLEIDERDLYAQLLSGTDAAYGVALKDAGIVPNASPPGYVFASKEVSLEAVKALGRVRGLEGDGELCHPEVAAAMATPWLHFLELGHAQLSLPTVRSMKRFVETGGRIEAEILERGRFDRFAMQSPEERAYYRELVGDATARLP